MSEFLEKNLQVLAQRHPHAARALEGVRPEDAGGVEVFPARSGAPTARAVLPDGRTHTLHSAYDPVKEARRFASASGASPRDAVVVLGFALGHHIRPVQELVGTDGYVAVIEAHPPLLTAALRHLDLRDILKQDNFSLFLGTDAAELAEWLKSIATDLIMRNFVLCEHEPSMRTSPSAYEGAHAHIMNILHSARAELVTLQKNAGIFFENTWRNLPAVARGGGARDLFGRFAGLPAINIAAGPSLDSSMPALKQAADDKALIIAVDTALKPLLENDIVPHMVVAVDPSEMNARYFDCVEGRDMNRCILVCSMSVHPLALERFDGPTYFIDEDNRICRFLRPYVGERGKMNTGLSVAHTAFYLARNMGCDPIVLVAQDLAFADGRTHATGTERTWGGDVDMSDSGWIWLEGNDGKKVPSLPMFRSFLATFEWEIAATRARVVNATEGGALIRGCERRGLCEMLNSLHSDVGHTLAGIRKHVGAIDLAALAERCVPLKRRAEAAADDARRAAGQIDRTLGLAGSPGRSSLNDAIKKANKALTQVLEYNDVLEILEDVMIEVRLALRYKQGGRDVRAELARSLDFARSTVEAAEMLARCTTHFLNHQMDAKQ